MDSDEEDTNSTTAPEGDAMQDHAELAALKVRALRLLDDEEFAVRFWRRGFEELRKHAVQETKTWVGGKLLAIIGMAMLSFGLYLVLRYWHGDFK